MLHFSAAPIEQVGWRWLWKRCFGAVSAFSTIPSEVFFDVFDAKKRRTRRRPSLMYCGDDQDAKAVAATLIRDVGFDPADAGRLRIARYLEAFALAMA